MQGFGDAIQTQTRGSCAGGSFLCFVATLYWTVRAISWLGSLLGPARTPVATALAAWFAASAWLATRDVRSKLLPPQETPQQNGTAPAVASHGSTDNLASAAADQ